MKERNQYNTKSRRLIIEYLEKNSHTTVSVADITKHLENLGETVNLTTVYRYLNKLNSEKKILKFSEDNGGKAVYQIIKHKCSCDGHIHIQCTNCGKLLHLDCEFMDDFKNHLQKDHNFELKCEKSLLYGICGDCAKKK